MFSQSIILVKGQECYKTEVGIVSKHKLLPVTKLIMNVRSYAHVLGVEQQWREFLNSCMSPDKQHDVSFI